MCLTYKMFSVNLLNLICATKMENRYGADRETSHKSIIQQTRIRLVGTYYLANHVNHIVETKKKETSA